MNVFGPNVQKHVCWAKYYVYMREIVLKFTITYFNQRPPPKLVLTFLQKRLQRFWSTFFYKRHEGSIQFGIQHDSQKFALYVFLSLKKFKIQLSSSVQTYYGWVCTKYEQFGKV